MKTRKNSSNVGEFTFEMRLSSEQIEQLCELTKQDPTRRSIIARMDDGSYRVLGEVVKLPDCPQEEFDKALEMMSEHANGYENEHPRPVQGSIAQEADLDELIKQEMVKVYETYTRPDYIEENTTEAAYDFDAHIARHFAEWGAERADKPIYEVSSRGKSAMGDKFVDWLQFGTHAIWDWMVKTDWYKKLNDMSDELIVKIYLGKKYLKR